MATRLRAFALCSLLLLVTGVRLKQEEDEECQAEADGPATAHLEEHATAHLGKKSSHLGWGRCFFHHSVLKTKYYHFEFNKPHMSVELKRDPAKPQLSIYMGCSWLVNLTKEEVKWDLVSMKGTPCTPITYDLTDVDHISYEREYVRTEKEEGPDGKFEGQPEMKIEEGGLRIKFSADKGLDDEVLWGGVYLPERVVKENLDLFGGDGAAEDFARKSGPLAHAVGHGTAKGVAWGAGLGGVATGIGAAVLLASSPVGMTAAVFATFLLPMMGTNVAVGVISGGTYGSSTSLHDYLKDSWELGYLATEKIFRKLWCIDDAFDVCPKVGHSKAVVPKGVSGTCPTPPSDG